MVGQDTDIRQKKPREVRKRATKKAAKKLQNLEKVAACLPQISELDLLAYQYAHFGDDSRPAEWFVDPEIAADPNYKLEDDLGYYADGARRTLTDANIEFFRALESRQPEEERRDVRDSPAARDLLGEDAANASADDASNHAPATRQRRRRSNEIPYEERNKRQWEQYIADEDAVEGSLTHRRIVRELDDQKVEEVDMDY